jgi:hypothetical protein
MLFSLFHQKLTESIIPPPRMKFFLQFSPIFLTTGVYLPDFLGLYWTGLVPAKKSGPKIWSIKSEIC